MRFDVDVPDLASVLGEGFPVGIARPGEKWTGRHLGDDRKQKGVYVFHHDQRVRYVGKTDGGTMSFEMRLRRELQERAAQGGHVFADFVQLIFPPPLKVVLFPTQSIRRRIQCDHGELSDTLLHSLFEVSLIHAYQPDFNRETRRGPRLRRSFHHEEAGNQA